MVHQELILGCSVHVKVRKFYLASHALFAESARRPESVESLFIAW